jgi:hypothetical protein
MVPKIKKMTPSGPSGHFPTLTRWKEYDGLKPLEFIDEA